MRETPRSQLDRLLAETADGGGPCPDANDLAGFAEGRLDAAQEDAVLAHLAACAACRDVADALGGAVEVGPTAARRTRRTRRSWAAAALLLVGVGAAAVLLSRGGPSEGGTRPRLAAAADVLAARVPALREAFVPLTDAELQARDADALRGDDEVILPAGRILAPRPAISWPAVRGASAYRLTLLGAEGEIWQRTVGATTYVPEEPLEAGRRYVLYVEADDPHRTRATTAFEVVSADEAAAWSRAVEEAQASVGEPLCWLLLAHAALREDLRSEAVAFASRYADAVPDDELGQATLARARDRLHAR